ncbi:MAG: hypothetical protein WDW38_008933 [Sanguina aurantia]
MADVKKDSRMLFVRGIGFDVDEKAVEAAFSDVGPIKQCFLIKTKGEARHKGFGFVEYALKEDADRAVLEMQGKDVGGRKVLVELANTRAPLEQRKRKRTDVDDDYEAAQDAVADKKQAVIDKQEAKEAKRTAAIASRKDAKAAAVAAPAAAEDVETEADAVAAALGSVKEGGKKAFVRPAVQPAPYVRPAAIKRAKPVADAAAEAKHKLIRAVAIGNLSAGHIKAVLSMAARCGKVEEVLNPAPPGLMLGAKLAADGCTGEVVVVVYKTVMDATEAVAIMHNQPLPPLQQQQHQQPKKSKKDFKLQGKDAPAAAVAAAAAAVPAASSDLLMWARQVSGDGALVKRWRLILRNLAFKCLACETGLAWPGLLRVCSRNRPSTLRLSHNQERAGTGGTPHLDSSSRSVTVDLCGRMVVADWAVARTAFELAKKEAEESGAAASSPGGGRKSSGHEDGYGDSEDGDEDEDMGADDEDSDDEGAEGDGDEDGSGDDGEGEESEGEEREMGMGSSDEDGEGYSDEDDEGEEESEEEQPAPKSKKGKAAAAATAAAAAVAAAAAAKPAKAQKPVPVVPQAPEVVAAKKEKAMHLSVLDSLLSQEDKQSHKQTATAAAAAVRATPAPSAAGRLLQKQLDEAAAAAAAATAARKGAALKAAAESAAAVAAATAANTAANASGVSVDDGTTVILTASGKVVKPSWQGMEVDVPEEEGEEGEGAKRRKNSGNNSAESIATTVFVRGLPLDVTSVELSARLTIFGPLKACRLVMNKASGKPKGTAFVEFGGGDAASKAAEACARGRLNKGPGITLKGSQLEVDMAVGQDAARALVSSAVKVGVALWHVETAFGRAGVWGTGVVRRQGQDAARALVSSAVKVKSVGKDKRNMYLSKEGMIGEGSPAWTGMSSQDQMKRKRAQADKEAKLRSPNFMVSPTRLSIRNIPRTWGEKELKDAFMAGVVARATQAKPNVKQVKILRETERLDADGLPLSKGLGFVEFADPEHALAALRQLNNNPAAFTPDKRPIVEFAIENVKIVKSREAMVAKVATRRASLAAAQPKVSIEEAAAATRAKKVEKREKREAKRLAKKGGAAAPSATPSAVSAKAAIAGGSSPGAAAAAAAAAAPKASSGGASSTPASTDPASAKAAKAPAPSDASVMQAVMAAVVEGGGAAAAPPPSAAAAPAPASAPPDAAPAAAAAAAAAAPTKGHTAKEAEALSPEAEAEAKKESKRQVKRGKQKDRAAKKKAGFIAASGGLPGRPSAPVLRPVRPAAPPAVGGGGVAAGGVVKPVAAARKPAAAAAAAQRPARQIGGAGGKGASEDAAALKRGRADDAEIDMIAASIGSGGAESGANMNGGLRAMGRRGKGGGRSEGVEASDGKKAKRQSGPAENDRLDKIVADYRVKLFGPGAGEGGAAAAGAVPGKAGGAFGIDLKRWFE